MGDGAASEDLSPLRRVDVAVVAVGGDALDVVRRQRFEQVERGLRAREEDTLLAPLAARLLDLGLASLQLDAMAAAASLI